MENTEDHKDTRPVLTERSTEELSSKSRKANTLLS